MTTSAFRLTPFCPDFSNEILSPTGNNISQGNGAILKTEKKEAFLFSR